MCVCVLNIQVEFGREGGEVGGQKKIGGGVFLLAYLHAIILCG